MKSVRPERVVYSRKIIEETTGKSLAKRYPSNFRNVAFPESLCSDNRLISDLKLSARARNCLMNNLGWPLFASGNIPRVSDLAGISYGNLLSWPNFGLMSLHEIVSVLGLEWTLEEVNIAFVQAQIAQLNKCLEKLKYPLPTGS